MKMIRIENILQDQLSKVNSKKQNQLQSEKGK